MNGTTGMIYLSTPTLTVGLIVKDGIVVDAPPIARRWTIGRDARAVWRQAARKGARLAWVPDTPTLAHMRAGSDSHPPTVTVTGVT